MHDGLAGGRVLRQGLLSMYLAMYLATYLAMYLIMYNVCTR